MSGSLWRLFRVCFALHPGIELCSDYTVFITTFHLAGMPNVGYAVLEPGEGTREGAHTGSDEIKKACLETF